LVGESFILSLKELRKVSSALSDKYSDRQGYKAFIDLSKTNSVLEDMYEHYAEGFAKHLYEATNYFCDNSLRNDPEFWKSKII